MKYKIVFKGKISSEFSEDEIVDNLVLLMDQTPEIIRQKFFLSDQKEIILENGLGSDDAAEYKAAVEEAGLLVDIDLDFDLDEIEPISINSASIVNASKQHKSPEVDLTLAISEESINAARSVENKNVRQKFLEPQEFSLQKVVDNEEAAEKKRVDKLKQNSRKREVQIEVDDRDVEVIPPLLNSGVRIGRLRFLYRITFAIAILLACMNVLPLYLQDYLGNTGFVVSMIVFFIAFMFTLIVISQRFCDIDNLSFTKMAFVFVLLFTLLMSMLINDFYSLGENKLMFAKQFLNASSLDPDYFEMQEDLKAYIAITSKPYLLQKIDSIIKWFVYLGVIIGAVLLFSMPGIKGNNQFGGPSNKPGSIGLMAFIVSLIAAIYCGSYPYSSADHRAEHRLYQVDFYEYLGLSIPLPNEFQVAYRDYLKKNSTYSQ